MVVFTCNNCGDSVNKPKVDKHIQYECKRKHFAVSFCCVDCLKDFNIETVRDHTQCVTEEQRYSAKGFVPKASSEKGKRKQASWVDIVQSVINKENLQNDERQFLNIIAKFNNVPRKKNKFQNFCFSTAPAYRKKGYLVDKVFDMIESEFKAQQSQNQINTNNNHTSEDVEKKELNQENSPQEIKEKKNSIENENDQNKTKKKKKNKQSLENGVNNENEKKLKENVIPQSEKKKKKEKKDLNSSTDLENFLEINEVKIDQLELEKKSKKKKRKSEINGSNENADVQNVSFETNKITGEINKENGICEKENAESRMSKKEKKELKKKMKYEQEVTNVNSGIIKEDKEPISKKKKRKMCDNEKNEEPQQKILKIENTSQVSEIQNGRKFEWNEAITQVLQSKKNKPISISKVMKRVMNEYHSLNETSKKTENELEKIFLKKLKKMKNVQLDNDKAQLLDG